jgi:hypothetical protein
VGRRSEKIGNLKQESQSAESIATALFWDFKNFPTFRMNRRDLLSHKKARRWPLLFLPRVQSFLPKTFLLFCAPRHLSLHILPKNAFHKFILAFQAGLPDFSWSKKTKTGKFTK